VTLLATALTAAFLAWRKKLLASWFLRALVIVGPLGLVALEAGWTVTEVGRQPWIVYGLIRTADTVTPMPHLIVPFLLFTLLYLFLAVVVLVLLRRQVFASPR